jgi:hypothetical protein
MESPEGENINAKPIAGEVNAVWFSDVAWEMRYCIALLRIQH